MKPINHCPIGPEEIGNDLNSLGLSSGMTLIVHSSMSTIGWVLGGAESIVRSLLDAIGPTGTLAMPAATPLCGDPASWVQQQVPPSWLEHMREHLPLFSRETTPTSLGRIPETFRTWPGTLRSNHPLESICANGPLAHRLTARHSLSFSEGEDGPFGRLYEEEAWILLLGVGFNRCTALHFAETLAPKRRLTHVRFPNLEQGVRTWRCVENVADDLDTHFPEIGTLFLAENKARHGTIGRAPAILFPMRALVQTALSYFDTHLS